MRSAALVALAELVALAALIACGKPSEQRDKALSQLRARTSTERARAVREVAGHAGKSGEIWSALSRAARDPAREVRLAVAAALQSAPKAAELPAQDEGGPPDPDDVLGGLLSDPQDEVRVAAASALGARCGPRSKGYLLSAFGRSGAQPRAAIVEALTRCGSSAGEALAHEESRRRERALRMLEAKIAAPRAQGARELGLLGREQDVKALLPLLESRDGVVAAAAARALGEAGAAQVEPQLRAMLGEDATLISEAAADALAALGPEAVERALAQLSAAAKRGDEAADAAALALAGAPLPAGELCAQAMGALRPRAAQTLALAFHCHRGLLLRALEGLPFSPDEPLSPEVEARATALLAAALVVEEDAAEVPARAAAALSTLISKGAPELAAQAARAAQRLEVKGAGPALLAAVRRERKALEAERAEPRKRGEDENPSAAELARNAARGPEADREKYSALMAKLAARGKAKDARAGAQATLADLLKGASPARRRSLLPVALRAALALRAPGAAAEAKALSQDPDPEVAAAARGEPEKVEAQPDASLSRCLPELPAEGARALPPPRGCLAQVSDGLLDAATAARARAAAGAALYSEDGRERASACAVLQRLSGAAPDSRLSALANDPEKRVRDACSPTGKKTAAPKGR